MSIRPQFKPAKLYDAGGDITKEWYVSFHFMNPETGKYERYKERFEMNRIHDYNKRLLYGQRAVHFVDRQLAGGFNAYQEKRSRTMDSGNNLDLVIKVASQLSDGATESAKKTYDLMKNRWSWYVEFKRIEHLPVGKINIDIATDFQNYLKVEKKLARKTVNVSVQHMGLFWDELLRKKVVTINPFRQVKPVSKKEIRRQLIKPKDPYVPVTPKELETIVKYLNKVGKRGFLRFLAMIYYGWVRPKEITLLKVGNVDMQNKTIQFTGDSTKNERSAMIQIVDELYQLLSEMNIDSYPQDYYLFSTNYLPGRKKLLANNACWKIWDRWIKDHLKIDKNPYSLKHSGNIHYLISNKGKYDPKWHQHQNRHSSIAQTEAYCRDLGVYFVDTDQLKFSGFI